MKTKAAPPIQHLRSPSPSAVLQAYFEVNQLKQLYRQGWLRVGVPPERCESVAEHSFGVALLSLFIAESLFPEADANRVLRIALLHDVGEARVGDITPHDPMDKAAKHAAERKAVHEILARLPRGAEYIAAWEEYERGESLEARLVRQVDRLEMGMQAAIYEHQGMGDLEEFFESVRRACEDDAIKALLEELRAVRPSR